MKKITGYIIRNNRGKEIYVGENKAEAARLMARAAMRGWAWNLKEVSVEINEKPIEWWEVEGFKQNPLELGYNERL